MFSELKLSILLDVHYIFHADSTLKFYEGLIQGKSFDDSVFIHCVLLLPWFMEAVFGPFFVVLGVHSDFAVISRDWLLYFEIYCCHITTSMLLFVVTFSLFL